MSLCSYSSSDLHDADTIKDKSKQDENERLSNQDQEEDNNDDDEEFNANYDDNIEQDNTNGIEDDLDDEDDDIVLDLSIKTTTLYNHQQQQHLNCNKRKKKPIKNSIEFDSNEKIDQNEKEQENQDEVEVDEERIEQDEILMPNEQEDSSAVTCFNEINESSINEEIDYSTSSINNSTYHEDEDQHSNLADTILKTIKHQQQQQHSKQFNNNKHYTNRNAKSYLPCNNNNNKNQLNYSSNTHSIAISGGHAAITAGGTSVAGSKKQMRFQCRFCVYKSHSVSLMQNHIYRHIDTTPYSCYYCGHKSTTKSTIMVHIELCHPNMEVKIKESRVKEEDYYLDLNSANSQSDNNNNSTNTTNNTNINSNTSTTNNILLTSFKDTNKQKFEIIATKCHMNNDTPNPQQQQQQQISTSLSSSPPSLSSSSSSLSSVCSSPSVSPVPALKHQPSQPPAQPQVQSNENFISSDQLEEQQDKDGNNYVTVFNRPKQYFGSLYEPDKQYSCKLCTYTTNHKPSMEDHVYVHTNKRPYR